MTNISSELQLFDEHLTLKNYSLATRKAYRCALGQFLHWRLKKGMTNLDQNQARQYILYRYNQGVAWQTVNGDYSAMMKYFRYVKKLEWDVEHIPRPRKERQLPRIISKALVQKMIAYAPNLKHQTFICLLYGTGIRLGEALNLEISHIDGERKQLLIACGKGAKDRYVDIPDCLLDLLRHYYRMYRPIKYLFNGEERGRVLAPRSAQHLIKEICKRAGIAKSVSPHTFRHCYATHHLENGSDLVYLQQQLGHKHLKTTAKYIHLMKEHSWRIHHPLAGMEIRYNTRLS